MAINIYQPLVFVGLGGTGCAIGTELERRLRQTLCGPDGMNFVDRMRQSSGTSPYLPYQLPGCVQFVYADLNEAELDRIHASTVPGPEHKQAATRNAHLVRGLVPKFRTYPDLAGHLRLAAPQYVQSWLPPILDEPRVAPITRGAGQLPTVGRAALFETVREDSLAAQLPLRNALDAVSRAGAELKALGGDSSIQSCDVFVAFSVAGGTGTGIFYDYLHLIADVFQQHANGIGAQIYPLVLMPSAFDEGKGGGRAARLNSGRALLDLFRLVDDQNARKGTTRLSRPGTIGRPVDVSYPGGRRIQVPSGTVQTGFLFSRTPGMGREDIHRSIASLVLSLIAAEKVEGVDADSGEVFQSFADSFINAAADRSAPADSGIGYRGVSTGLVASLTVPGDDLAGLVAGRLLARAIGQLETPSAGGTEQNEPMIMRLAKAANMGEVVDRPGLPVTAARMVDGATEIRQSLSEHTINMEATLHQLRGKLAQEVPLIAAQQFQPLVAVETLLGEVDVFRLQRILYGHGELTGPADRVGLRGLLEARKNTPPQPPGGAQITPSAPQLPDVRNKTIGKAKWGEAPVPLALTMLRVWFEWNTKRLYNEAWAGQVRVWQPKVDAAGDAVNRFADQLRVFARGEPEEFARRSVALTRDRNGVRQLLPAGGNLDIFVRQVQRRFVASLRLPEGAAEAEVVRGLLANQDWQVAFKEVTERADPEAAVTILRNRLKQHIEELFAQAERHDAPLLPSMGRLLARAANSRAPKVDDLDMRLFQDQMAALLPGGFSPQGVGALKILVAYPPTDQATDADIQGYLKRSLALPVGSPVFRPGQPDSIVVVLFRSSMSVDEVPEVRQLLNFWAQAQQHHEPNDRLRWRQRLGYDFGWLVTTDDHRELILFRLMCAMWNGLVTVDGPPHSPRSITVAVTGYDDSASMELKLRRLGRTSSWGYLLRAYEEWAIDDNHDSPLRRRFATSLSTILPDGLSDDGDGASGDYAGDNDIFSDATDDEGYDDLDGGDAGPTEGGPDEVYRAFIEVARKEAARVEQVRAQLPNSARAWADQLYDFWKTTVPAAESRPIPTDGFKVRDNLRDLFEYKTRRGGAR